MYARWQLQHAKQKLSQLVRAAGTDGPQVITRQGEDAVVVVSLADFNRLRG
jgi:prevent-host-death family protein